MVVSTPAASAATVVNPAPVDWSGQVALARLVAAAQAAHPTSAAVAAARAAAAAQVRQAGVWANPELEVYLGRTHPRVADLEQDQPYGGSLRQRLTWWGARNARVAAARAQLSVAEAEATVALLDLGASVRRAAIVYAAAVDAVAQAADDARIATDLATMARIRQEAGEADRASAARATLEATTATLRREARGREVATALAVLRTWCDPALPDGLIIADAFAPFAVDAPSAERAAQMHPQLRALAEATAAADATVTAERRERLPDLTVGVYAEREAEKDTFGVSLGVDIPLWNRNDAGIAAAEAARARARALARSEQLRLDRDLAEALGAVQTAQGEAQALAELAMPAADEAIRLRTTAFDAGESSMSDLLEARRAANAVRNDLRDARLRAALALVDLGLAVGDPALGLAPAMPPSP